MKTLILFPGLCLLLLGGVRRKMLQPNHTYDSPMVTPKSVKLRLHTGSGLRDLSCNAHEDLSPHSLSFTSSFWLTTASATDTFLTVRMEHARRNIRGTPSWHGLSHSCPGFLGCNSDSGRCAGYYGGRVHWLCFWLQVGEQETDGNKESSKLFICPGCFKSSACFKARQKPHRASSKGPGSWYVRPILKRRNLQNWTSKESSSSRPEAFLDWAAEVSVSLGLASATAVWDPSVDLRDCTWRNSKKLKKYSNKTNWLKKPQKKQDREELKKD